MTAKKVKIDIYSDLHLDSWLRQFNQEQIQIKPTKGTDICLFAGDAGNGPEWYSRAMRLLKSKYQKVIGVPGNHDWYNSAVFDGILSPLSMYDPSLRVYEACGLTIATATLWTNFRGSEVSMELCANPDTGIADFRGAIPNMTGPLMKRLNDESWEFLANLAGEVDVVMTHFAPIRNSEHPLYAATSSLNPYFINDEPELVERIDATLWVHGHTHKKFDYQFLDTRVVANPIGYCLEEQNQPIFMPKHVAITPK